MQHILQYRKEREDLVRDLACSPRQRGEPGRQILQNREAWKDLAALRHQRQTGARTLVRRKVVEEPILPADAAGADRLESADRPQETGLADAVPAENAGDLTLSRSQADPTQRVARAVIEVDAFDRQHHSAAEIDFD